MAARKLARIAVEVLLVDMVKRPVTAAAKHVPEHFRPVGRDHAVDVFDWTVFAGLVPPLRQAATGDSPSGADR